MCKKLIVLVFCAAVLFSGAAMAEVDDSGRLIVPEASVAPIIDGELDDVWQNVGEEGVLITDIINAGGNVPPDDDSDLSSTFKVMYDADNIYFFLAAQDSVIDYEFSNHNGDGVEIYFDGDNSKGSSYDGVNDNQIRITVDDVELANIDSSLPVDGSAFKVILTDLGYNIEASFPLETLQIVPENTFGFEVQINDNDGGGGRETMIRWFSNDNNSWQDSSLFGEAILAAEPPAALPEGWQSQDIGTTGGSAAESDGTWAISADGADVWDNSDQFHYAYVPLSGDGEIVARVVDNGTGSNNWAKGGVMIRETLDPDSKHSIMALTGSEGGGITFQGRPVTGERSNSMHGDITASPPHWVKLTREGNTITAYHSADGVYWELFTDTVTDGDITNPIDVEMVDPVLIGLFVTSHQDGEIRTYTFDNMSVIKPVDVTAPGDAIQGVPNDGDWPGAETPDLAIDDDTSTKYLHFKGETETTGFQVTPSSGGSIVTGLTLTTANDAAERDPVAFELSGSNESIDGPYELIASGDIVDFAQADAWPRFTMNATPISFKNDTAYAHYQVLFPAVRDAASANSMQIAEVELLGVPGPSGPILHYKLDDGEGVIAVDSSGNGNDGTLEDSPTVVDGQFGQALAFDFSRVAIPASDSLTADLFQESFTLSAWINPMRTGNTWQQIFRSVTASATNDTLFLNNDGRLSWRGTVGGGWAGGMCETASDVVPADQWTQFAVTGDGTNFRIYVNGVLSQESAFQTTDGANTTYYIGGDPGTAGESYSGMIDEVLIYDRALSADEVSELAGKAVDPSLVIYYSFDDVGEIVADQSGKGHDGVVVGEVTAEPEGMYNGAANFASGSYLDLDGPSFPAEDIPTSAMTLAAWIKIANTGGDHEIFSARASDESWLIHPEPKSSGDIRWLLRSYGGTTIFQIRAGTITWDEWLHFAGTYDKDSAKAALYINGELIEEIVVESPADIAGDWDLGARVGYTIDNARPFTGLMDEFRMYTRALSQDEILTIMQGM